MLNSVAYFALISLITFGSLSFAESGNPNAVSAIGLAGMGLGLLLFGLWEYWKRRAADQIVKRRLEAISTRAR
jgi:hypothetical protein